MRWLGIPLVVSVAGLLAAQPPLVDPNKDLPIPPRPGKVALKAPEPDKPIGPHATADGAVKAALRDAALYFPFLETPFFRYLWIPGTDEEDFKATALALNYVSRSTHLAMFNAVPMPGGVLVRVDLRALFPRADDLVEGVRTWEEFQFDPSSSLLLTRDVLELAKFPDALLPKVKRRGVRKRTVDEREVLEPFEEEVNAREANVDVVRLDAPDIDPAAFAALRQVTLSNAPVVDYRYFIFRALSTIKDDGAYKVIFGGLYYDLRGIRKANEAEKKKGLTDLDVLLISLGIGSENETFEKFLDRIRGDLRPAMFISDVTGNKRAVILVHAATEREGGSWGGFTFDLKRKSIDVKQDPILSQIRPRIDAIELILPGQNGMPIFALFQGFDDKGVFQGKLLEKADSDVACDRTVPSPHSTDLQAGISCIRCHGPKETWQDLRDDVALLLEQDRVRVLTDVTNLNELSADTQDRILGLHSVIPGRPPGRQTRQARVLDKLLSRQRDDFLTTVTEATGPWKRLEGRQADVAKTASQKIADVFGAYWYTPVDARSALLDVGLDVPAAKAPQALTRLLGMESQPVLGVQFESIRQTHLAAGGKEGRVDWALERSFTAARVRKAVTKILQEAKKP